MLQRQSLQLFLFLDLPLDIDSIDEKYGLFTEFGLFIVMV